MCHWKRPCAEVLIWWTGGEVPPFNTHGIFFEKLKEVGLHFRYCNKNEDNSKLKKCWAVWCLNLRKKIRWTKTPQLNVELMLSCFFLGTLRKKKSQILLPLIDTTTIGVTLAAFALWTFKLLWSLVAKKTPNYQAIHVPNSASIIYWQSVRFIIYTYVIHIHTGVLSQFVWTIYTHACT